MKLAKNYAYEYDVIRIESDVKNKKNVNCYLCRIFLAMRLCQSTTLIQTLRSHQQYIAMKFGF